jgi:hypothetical protein
MPCRAETIVALYSNYRLRYFDSATLGTFSKSVDLTGIPTDEAPAGLDFRSTGALLMLTNKGTKLSIYQGLQAQRSVSNSIRSRRRPYPAFAGPLRVMAFLPPARGRAGSSYCNA